MSDEGAVIRSRDARDQNWRSMGVGMEDKTEKKTGEDMQAFQNKGGNFEN